MNHSFQLRFTWLLCGLLLFGSLPSVTLAQERYPLTVKGADAALAVALQSGNLRHWRVIFATPPPNAEWLSALRASPIYWLLSPMTWFWLLMIWAVLVSWHRGWRLSTFGRLGLLASILALPIGWLFYWTLWAGFIALLVGLALLWVVNSLSWLSQETNAVIGAGFGKSIVGIGTGIGAGIGAAGGAAILGFISAIFGEAFGKVIGTLFTSGCAGFGAMINAMFIGALISDAIGAASYEKFHDEEFGNLLVTAMGAGIGAALCGVIGAALSGVISALPGAMFVDALSDYIIIAAMGAGIGAAVGAMLVGAYGKAIGAAMVTGIGVAIVTASGAVTGAVRGAVIVTGIVAGIAGLSAVGGAGIAGIGAAMVAGLSVAMVVGVGFLYLQANFWNHYFFTIALDSLLLIGAVLLAWLVLGLVSVLLSVRFLPWLKASKQAAHWLCQRDYHRFRLGPGLPWPVRWSGRLLMVEEFRQHQDFADYFVCRYCGQKDFVTAQHLIGVIGATPSATAPGELSVWLFDPARRQARSVDIDRLDLHPPPPGQTFDYDYAVNAVLNALSEDHHRRRRLQQIPVRIHGQPPLPENTRRMLADRFGRIEGGA